MTITIRGKKVDLGELNYVEALAARRDLAAAQGALDTLLERFARRAEKEFGIKLSGGGGAFTTRAAKPPKAPKARKRWTMSEEQKQRLRERQQAIWARKRAAKAEASAAVSEASAPRLVPPGTHA